METASDLLIDQFCIEFENAAQQGQPLPVTEVVAKAPPEIRNDLLRELLLIAFSSAGPDTRESQLREYLDTFSNEEALVREAYRLAATAICEPSLSPGDTVDRYEILQLIGEGAFGKVYKANDRELNRIVALKAPRLDGQASGFDVDRFIGEAQTLAKLRHPGIVAIHDILRTPQGAPLLVMDYIEGTSLREEIDKKTLTLQEGVRILSDVAEAANYAHKQGVVHRDLTPRNILIDESCQVRVVDFGLSLHESEQDEKRGEAAGSLRYMAPEQLRGESQWLDGRADVWAIGVILYEILTGRPPFRGTDFSSISEQVLGHPPKPPGQVVDNVPPHLESVCRRCLQIDPGERFSTAADLAVALRKPPNRSSRLVLAVAAVLALTVLAWTVAPRFRSTVESTGEQLRAVTSGALELSSIKVADDFKLNVVFREEDTQRVIEPNADGVYEFEPDRILEMLVMSERACVVSAISFSIDGQVVEECSLFEPEVVPAGKLTLLAGRVSPTPTNDADYVQFIASAGTSRTRGLERAEESSELIFQYYVARP